MPRLRFFFYSTNEWYYLYQYFHWKLVSNIETLHLWDFFPINNNGINELITILLIMDFIILQEV